MENGWHKPIERSASAGMSRAKAWSFRLLCVVVVPVLLLAAVEGVLRLASFGFPARFLIPWTIEGRPVDVENQRFGWLFFDPSIARDPEAIVLPPKKPERTLRVFVLGGSAAQGDPDPAYSLSRMLRVMLSEAFPDTRFEIHNAAMTAINSHAVREIARDCARFKPDVFVIYMGHNEVVGPYGPGSVFRGYTPSLPLIRTGLALRKTRLGQLLAHESERADAAAPPGYEWEGMRVFLNHRVAPDDPSWAAVEDHYEKNLRAIMAYARHVGARVLLGTLASNLRACAPFASLHRSDLSPEDLGIWRNHYAYGRTLEEQGAWAAALNKYNAAKAIDPLYAELRYRMARCEEALENPAAARAEYARARDFDALHFRASSNLNTVLRALAASRANVTLVDVQARFRRRAEQDVPGFDLFYDHVHFNFRGTWLAAEAFYEPIAASLAGTRNVPPAASIETVRRRLAFTPREAYRISEKVYERLSAPPFIEQAYHNELLGEWLEVQRRLRKQRDALSPEETEKWLSEAVKQAPDDWRLHMKAGNFYRSQRRFRAAAAEYRRAVRLVPHRNEPRLKLALCFGLQGQSDAGVALLTSDDLQLPMREDEACNQLGVELLNQGAVTAALGLFERALRLDPDNAEAHNNLGLAFYSLGRTKQAQAHYEACLRLRPGHARAHNNLGVLLMNQGALKEAARQFREGLAAHPDFAELQHNLGLTLQKLGDREGAAEAFRKTIALKPNLVEPYKSLGAVLYEQGKTDEAIRIFKKGLAYRPEDPSLHNNLGGLYLMKGRLPSARREIKAALALAPEFRGAKENMSMLEKLEKQRNTRVSRRPAAVPAGETHP